PSRHLYPWVDLQENRSLRSIYTGQEFAAEEFIREDLLLERQREGQLAELLRNEQSVSAADRRTYLEFIEATLPFNCEHVVPQSWFDKRQPMRGDLHHLFACQSHCNSFRSNIPYFDFADFEEVVRVGCGKREDDRFEPKEGKGPAARATLYFLLRYPGQVNDRDGEFRLDRLDMLLRWHSQFPVTRYEQHRNAAIAAVQGNRNPLIDFSDWAERIDFRHGFGG
ncbi:MAG TPA: endonuclease, partial [Thermomicrobiales bacterium]|nr:endonuclease [Thermomicrobiales bacterium]